MHRKNQSESAHAYFHPGTIGRPDSHHEQPVTQFLIRRTFWAVFLFLTASLVTYVLFFVLPSDPAALAAGKASDPHTVGQIRHNLRASVASETSVVEQMSAQT